ncbi:MAG: Gfo/Idh/MocA family oxidoreductase [Chitinophagaceae bacterium]
MIRFALAGLGNIGKRHAEHILNHPQAQLVAVCDIDRSKASVADVPFFEHIGDMLRETDADVVCVCTPNYLHEPHAVAALRSGRHVVVEKPMALSVAECDRMIAASEESGKLIFAVKQNRYNPPVAAVKELIDSGRLGKVFLVQVNCFWNRGDSYYAQSDWRGRKEKDGGCLFTQFSHFVDILYYLNGTIVSAQGMVANFAHQHNTEFEDSGSFVMQGANGSLINFNFTTTAFEKNMEGAITVFAEHGTVKIGGQYLNTIEYQQLEGAALPSINISAKNNDYGLYQGSMSNHDKLIDNVVRVLEHGDTMTTTAAEGREVVRMIELMYRSA